MINLKKLNIELNQKFFSFDLMNTDFEYLNIKKFSDILFISDIECVDKSIYDEIFQTIRDNKIKILFFVGDVFTFANSSQNEIEKLKNALIYFKENKLDILDEFVLKKYLDTQELITNEKEVISRINDFYDFINNCNKLGIPIVYYKGNHDADINKDYIFPNKKLISEYIYFPSDLDLIKLNDRLFITGVNRISDKKDSECKCYCNFYLKNSNDKMSNLCKFAKDTIFLSHHPSTNKYTYLGSYDITMFKDRFKFKLHIHGHVKNYKGVYDDCKTPNVNLGFNFPTLSAHYSEGDVNHYYKDKNILEKIDNL